MSRFSRLLAAGALVSLTSLPLGSGAATVTAPVVFEAPAAHAPAGPTSLTDEFGRILPSGRFLHPSGTSVVVGMNALGVALSPTGRYAIVSNDDELQAQATSELDHASTGGYSLAVVDTRTMTVVSRYRNPAEAYFAGVVALPDPALPGSTLVLASGGASGAVFAFDLDASGTLTPDAHHTIPIPAPIDATLASGGHSFPGTLTLGPRGDRVFVIDNVGDDVVQIDAASRTVIGPPVPVGYFPFGAATSSVGLLVADEGLMAYPLFPSPSGAPPFAAPPADLTRASALSTIGFNGDGSLGDAVRAPVPLDPTPDGVLDVGGAHPSAVAAMRSRPFAFVALAGVDRIATISLAGVAPRAIGGTELRLYNRGPYGTQPGALAVAPGDHRLYVALAGINAIAVLDISDPTHPHRVGLIPTGWDPTALALSADGRYLYVANAKGIGHDRGFTGDVAGIVDSKARVLTVVADSTAVWSTLERIDLRRVDLRHTTPQALSYLRTIQPARNNRLVPQRFGTAGSAAIKHVVLVLQGSRTYDGALGDLTDANGNPYGPGDPSYVAFDASVTPNLHALARAYALSGNFYSDAVEPNSGHQFAMGGIAAAYTVRDAPVLHGRRPVSGSGEDPEDYPRAGYIFNSLAQRGKSYRDYGDLLSVSGYDRGEAADLKIDDPAYAGPDDGSAPTEGLGGLYAYDVPAPLALSGHVDLSYPGRNPRIRNVRRAQEFIRDFDSFVRADRTPAFTSIWLPDGAENDVKNVPPRPEQVADGDRALGMIVEYLSRTSTWGSTAIFIVPDDSRMMRDHADVSRSYALVVSPFAKRRYLSRVHLSTASVLKTEEEVLGLPALSLGDALASDMSDFFTTVPNLAPYVRIDAAPASI